MRYFGRFLVLGLAAVALTGCNSAPKRDPQFAPARPVVPPPSPVGDGTIYHEGHSLAWFEDLKARRVGDLLTVRLTERTDASKSASTASAKSNSNNIGNPTLLGVEPKFGLPDGSNGNLSFSTGSEHEFAGQGSSTQKNALTGDVTVTVTEVLPNGNLIVRGEKRIGINQGNEYVKLAGIVRPLDIDSSNTVDSTKIADPTIVYVGDGQVGDSGVMGWLSRFFISALMPF